MNQYISHCVLHLSSDSTSCIPALSMCCSTMATWMHTYRELWGRIAGRGGGMKNATLRDLMLWYVLKKRSKRSMLQKRRSNHSKAFTAFRDSISVTCPFHVAANAPLSLLDGVLYLLVACIASRVGHPPITFL